ncbi:MAG: type II secretion system F family protein [Endomicrobiales bacterium]
MPKYIFKAKSMQGETVEGSRAAGSEKELVGALRGEGLVVFRINEVKEEPAAREKKGSSGKALRKGGKIKYQDVAVFSRQLATMINSGVSILDAVDDIADMVMNQRFHRLLKGIAGDIREGSTFSDAMKKYQKIFGRVFISMVAAGEKSGKLGKVLLDMASYLENSVKLKRKVRAASVYPLSVAAFFFLVLCGIVLFLIPRFKTMFGSFGVELPLPTRVVMGISDAGIRNFHWLALLAIGLVTSVTMIYRTPPGRFFFDELKLNLPILGGMVSKIVFARFFQSLATLLKSGVDIISSLEIAAKVTDNMPIEQVINTIKGRVIEGSTLSSEMERSPVFPRMVCRMTAVGEKSGKLDEMFNKLSDYYNDEVDALVSSMSSIIEPALIIFLGFIIGIVVVTMYLPIFKMAMAAMAGH